MKQFAKQIIDLVDLVENIAESYNTDCYIKEYSLEINYILINIGFYSSKNISQLRLPYMESLLSNEIAIKQIIKEML